MDLATGATGIAALAEPVRRALYEYVVAQRGPVGREQAASGVDVAAHVAKFHLDRLVDDGLLEVEFRRLSGRSGPGAGRPSKLYRRSEAEWSVSLPERRYDLVGHLLASGVERSASEGMPLAEALDDSAAVEGRRIGGSATGYGADAGAGAWAGAGAGEDAGGDDLVRLSAVLRGQGYEPWIEDGSVLLANCPFDTLAKEHTELVCRLNRSFVQGVADGLACHDTEALLEPHEGRCCVRTTRRTAPDR